MPKQISKTEREGRRLAAEMMETLAREWKAVDVPDSLPDALTTEYMVSREPSTFRSYLTKAKENPEQERGFLCVLSDWIGAEMSQGQCMTPRAYSANTERRN